MRGLLSKGSWQRSWSLCCLLAALVLSSALTWPAGAETQSVPAATAAPARVYLPYVRRPCDATGASYGTTPVRAESFNADSHPDLNLSVRGYEVTDAPKHLVSYGGATDSRAPQLADLFSDRRAPTFRTVYRVYDWNWSTNQRGSLLSTWPVTLAGLAATSGELVLVPDSGYSVGDDAGYEVLVLYASESRITLKYTRDDSVVVGYTVHVENVCVDPNLLALYESAHRSGRGALPGLRARQPFGRAVGSEVSVAIRDCGSFMDPRSQKDWWQGFPAAAHLFLLHATGR